MSSVKSTYDQLGPLGVVGMLVMISGIGVISTKDVVIATGVSLVLFGVGVVVYSMIRSMMNAFGMVA